MLEYIKGRKKLGSDESRETAIEFARSMNGYQRNVDLKNSVISNMLQALKENKNLTTFETDIVCSTIEALSRDYEHLNFNQNSADVSFFSSDINSNLGYIYSFYPDQLY